MRTHSTTHMIAPLMLSLLLAIFTLACGLFGPSEADIANQTAIAVLQATIDKKSDQQTMAADAANRHATATEAAHTAQAILATQKAQEKQDKTATAAAISTATAGPALAEANAPAGWTLKMYDAFLDNTNRWWVGVDNSNDWVHDEWKIENNRYVVRTTAKQGFSVFNYPNRLGTLSTFYVTVDATLVSGEPSSVYGLTVNVQPRTGAFYAFQVTEEGYWSVALRQETYWAPVLSGNSSHIVKGENHLAVKGAPGEYIFYVNNEQIAIVHDDRLKDPGKIGVIVESTYGGAVSVTAFDNFTVLAP